MAKSGGRTIWKDSDGFGNKQPAIFTSAAVFSWLCRHNLVTSGLCIRDRFGKSMIIAVGPTQIPDRAYWINLTPAFRNVSPDCL